MKEAYDILWEEQRVGRVKAEKQGLYLLFSCRCRLPENGMYRIHAVTEDGFEDLGICVPMGEYFGTDRKIPAKRLNAENLSFRLVPKDWKPRETVFVQVTEEEPFEKLDKLENAVLQETDGETGILVITEAEQQI